MMLYLESLVDGSLEWAKADEKTHKQFFKYLDDFFKEHSNPMDVPLNFKEWRKKNG